MSGGGKTTVTSEERLSGVKLQSSSYGLPIPLYYKTHRVTGNIVWYGDFKAIEHRQTQSSGGKGGGGKQVNVSYTYSASFVLALGEGIITASSVMANKDGWKTPGSLGLESFGGALGQAAWGWLTANYPTENIGYSGTGYLAAANFDLGKSNSLPNFSVVLSCRAATTVGQDIEHFLSDPDVGAIFPASRLDGLADVSAYLTGKTFHLSAISQKQAADYIKDWCSAMNTETVWSEGKLKFKPRLDTLSAVANLTIDDFITKGAEMPVTVERKPQTDAYNLYRIEYLDAAHEYNVVPSEAGDQGNIELYGLRPSSVETVHSVHDSTLAKWVAQHRLQRSLYIRNTYRFRLGWKHCRLEPMDLVTLTEPILGLSLEPVLITSIEEDEDGLLTVEAEEYNGTVANIPAYLPAPTAGASQDHGVAPGNPNPVTIFEPPISLTGTPQIWMALSGGVKWGGAEVWASLDNARYQPIGTLIGNSRHGTLRAALATGISPDITNILKANIHRGELIGTTTQGASDLLTLCYADGEYIAFRDVALIGVGDYDMSYLIRGAYGSTAGAHLVNTPFVRCDDTLFKYEYPPEWVGKTVYIKVLGFNIYGAGKQSAADVTAITYTVTGKPLDGVQGLAVEGVFDTKACRVKWNAVIGAESYTVEVYTGGILRRTATTTDNRFAYTSEDAKSDGGLARSLTFRVRANGLAGQSGWAQVVASNAQIAAPVNATANAGFGSATVGADFPAESDYAGTIIWAGAANNFTINDAAKIYDGPDTSFSLKVDAGTTKWFRMAHYDVFGKDALNMSGYFSTTALALGGVQTFSGTPGTTHLGSDVVLSTTDDSLYTWNAALVPPAYERALPQVVANQITSINLKAISASIGELLLGKMVMDSFGYMRGGQTEFNNGQGFWLGYDSVDAKYKFSIGNSDGNNLTWDGTNLAVPGGAIIANSIGTKQIGSYGGGVDPTNTAIGFNCLLNARQAILSIAVTNGGSGYTNPSIVISLPNTGGSPAAATATVVGGVITSVTVTDGGSGYSSGATITAVDAAGINATFVATMSNAATNTGIGAYALMTNKKGLNNSAIGHRAAYALDGASDNNVAIGERALQNMASPIDNVAIGRLAMGNGIDNSGNGAKYNVAIGTTAMLAMRSGQANVAIGSESMKAAEFTVHNIALGYRSLEVCTGDSNVSIGGNSSQQLTTGKYNVAIGHLSGYGNASWDNTSCVGKSSQVTGPNQVQLGDSLTTTYVYGTVQNRSDARDKADIRDTVLGLSFVMALRPVDYRLDYREDYRVVDETGAVTEFPKDGSKKRVRFHHGLIAQEVKSVCEAQEVEFGGYQDHSINGGSDVLSIGYDEMVAPLIKAIQELEARLKIVESNPPTP